MRHILKFIQQNFQVIQLQDGMESEYIMEEDLPNVQESEVVLTGDNDARKFKTSLNNFKNNFFSQKWKSNNN